MVVSNWVRVLELSKNLLSLYIAKGITIPGTMIDRIVSYSLSSLKCAFINYVGSTAPQHSCGIVDSLRMLLMQENFVKPYSDVHVLATLLTKSF